MPADPRLIAGDAEHATPADPINAAAPIAAEWLDSARDLIDTEHLNELERLTAAAGELYGTALRDQLHRAITAIADNLLDARSAIHMARRERDDHLTRLCEAVDSWAADYRRIDTAYQQAGDELLRRRAELERTAAELAATRDRLRVDRQYARLARELATIVGTYRRGGLVAIDVMDDVLNRFASLQSADRHTPDPLAGEAPAEPQPGTPPAMPEANLGAARTRELLDELLARLDGRTCSYPRVDEVAAIIESAAAELPGDVLDYRTIGQ